MAIKIGINGFGRIGRIVLRIMCENPETFDIRGINLRKADIDYMVYLLKYDSVFRNFPGMVEHAGGDNCSEKQRKIYPVADRHHFHGRKRAFIIASLIVFEPPLSAS